MPNPDELTQLIRDAAGGGEDAASALFDKVYGELHGLASRRMAGERAGHTLQATALVSEVWLRLAGNAPVAFENRAHFFTAAAEAMRRILIEHARARGRVKRGGDARRVPLAGVDLADEVDLSSVLAVDQAIERLSERDPRLAELVRLRFYAGLGSEETAAALGLSTRTVRREWAVARAFLAREVDGSGASERRDG